MPKSLKELLEDIEQRELQSVNETEDKDEDVSDDEDEDDTVEEETDEDDSEGDEEVKEEDEDEDEEDEVEESEASKAAFKAMLKKNKEKKEVKEEDEDDSDDDSDEEVKEEEDDSEDDDDYVDEETDSEDDDDSDEEVKEEDEDEDEDDEEEIEEVEDEDEKKELKEELTKLVTSKMKNLRFANDIKNILGEDHDFDDDFINEAKTVYSAAVRGKINKIIQPMVNETVEYAYDRIRQERSDAITRMTEATDRFMDIMGQRWIEENRIETRQNLREDIANDVLSGIHKVLSENFVTVPESKRDLFEEAKAELEEQKRMTRNVYRQNLKIEEELREAKKQLVLVEASEGLSSNQAETLANLIEDVEYTSLAQYRKNVALLKKRFITESKSSVKNDSVIGDNMGFIEEEIDLDKIRRNNTNTDIEEIEEDIDPDVSKIVNRLKFRD